MEPGHLLHSALNSPSIANAQRLKSRHSFVPAAQQLSLSDNNNIRVAHWADHQWNAEAEWLENATRLRIFIPVTGTHPRGMTLPRTAWVRINGLINRFRTGVGQFRTCLHKRCMASCAVCECPAEEQTVDNVVLQCPIHGLHGLTVLDDETIEWLFNTCREM